MRTRRRTSRAQRDATHASDASAEALESRSGARSRRRRKDIAALERVRAARDAARPAQVPRGAVYVIPGHEDEPYELWAVRPLSRGGIVLRSKARPNAFLMEQSSGPFNPEWWRY